MGLDIFLDTANLEEVRQVIPWGIISGLTTNQKIFLREKGADFEGHVKALVSLVEGPVSIEVTPSGTRDFVDEAAEYTSWGKSIVIKVPVADGRALNTIARLEKAGIRTNATALMSSSQVLLAARAGASYTSLFFRRIQDCGEDPEKAVATSRAIIDRVGFKARLLVGSIRDAEDVDRAVIAGAHIVTVTHKILCNMPYHPKTEETIREFDHAWEEFNRSESRPQEDLVEVGWKGG